MNNEQKPQLTIPRVIGSLSFYNADNLEIMRGFKDNEFDLAIVDPPYQINDNASISGYTDGCRMNKLMRAKKNWDIKPEQKYFDELFRISKDVIIWGGNYFTDMLPPTREWLVWNKDKYSFKHSDFEMAYTSFSGVCKIVKIQHHGFLMKDKDIIHPTQKPVMLYDYILTQYAKTNFKILDTHLGSGSIAIAIEKANRLDKMNLQFVGIEIDKEYYEKALNRIEQYCRQGTLSFQVANNGCGYVQCRKICKKLNTKQKLMNIQKLKYEAQKPIGKTDIYNG